jgi:hypothetical protein
MAQCTTSATSGIRTSAVPEAAGPAGSITDRNGQGAVAAHQRRHDSTSVGSPPRPFAEWRRTGDLAPPPVDRLLDRPEKSSPHNRGQAAVEDPSGTSQFPVVAFGDPQKGYCLRLLHSSM